MRRAPFHPFRSVGRRETNRRRERTNERASARRRDGARDDARRIKKSAPLRLIDVCSTRIHHARVFASARTRDECVSCVTGARATARVVDVDDETTRATTRDE